MSEADREKKIIERLEDTFYANNGKGIKHFQKVTLYEEGIQDILQLLHMVEQKDKRIQELEEENVIQRRQLNSAFDNGYILHTYKIRKLIANKTIDISGFKCIAVEDLEELLEDK